MCRVQVLTGVAGVSGCLVPSRLLSTAWLLLLLRGRTPHRRESVPLLSAPGYARGTEVAQRRQGR